VLLAAVGGCASTTHFKGYYQEQEWVLVQDDSSDDVPVRIDVSQDVRHVRTNGLFYINGYPSPATAMEETSGLKVRFSNNSDHEIVLDLDSSVFIDERGQGKRVVRYEMPAEQRYGPQVPVTIPPRSTVEEKILPANAFRQFDGQWVRAEFLPATFETAKGARVAIQLVFNIDGSEKVRVTRSIRVVDFRRTDLVDDDVPDYVSRRSSQTR
jgi:hypothetical protein